MITMKKIGSLLLAFSLVATPAMINADNMDKNLDVKLINAKLEVEEDMVYEGYIGNINDKEDSISIWVLEEKEDNPQEALTLSKGRIFHISEDVFLLSDKTMDKVEADYLEKGMKVLVYYKANTPMTMSLPPQATPDGIVVRENKNSRSIKVSKFDDELVSLDNKLKLNIQEDTIIVDKNGEKLEKEDLKGKDLLVFYSVTTRSIPAQTSPHTVIVLNNETDEDLELEEDITVFDKILIDKEEEKTVKVLENVIYKNENNVLVIPLREVGEALGYEVKWNGEKRSTELIKGAQWTAVAIGEGTVGEDNYNFAKMIVKLGTPPVLKDSTTYVPVNFIEEVLQIDVSIEDGMLKIQE